MKVGGIISTLDFVGPSLTDCTCGSSLPLAPTEHSVQTRVDSSSGAQPDATVSLLSCYGSMATAGSIGLVPSQEILPLDSDQEL